MLLSRDVGKRNTVSVFNVSDNCLELQGLLILHQCSGFSLLNCSVVRVHELAIIIYLICMFNYMGSPKH